MNYESMFLLSLIGIVIFLAFIYQSKYKKLKRLTTILVIAFFCWSATKEQSNGIGIIIFLIIVGFTIFLWKKIDAEELEKNIITDTKEYKDFLKSIKIYNDYLKLSSTICHEELRHINVLPFDKNKLILDTLIYIKYLEKETQQSLLFTIPDLAFYIENIAREGFISKLSRGIEEKDEEFPYISYENAKNESNQIFNKLKDLINDKNYNYR